MNQRDDQNWWQRLDPAVALLLVLIVLGALGLLVMRPWRVISDESERPRHANGQTRDQPYFERLLGMEVTSAQVQEFVKTNGLVHEPSKPGYSFYSGTNSSFVLELRSNRVWQVCVALGTIEGFTESNRPRAYLGKMPYDLTRNDTPEAVVQRLGAPTRRKEWGALTSLYYDKLRLGLDFDRKSHLLLIVTWTEHFPGH
jgi:hypothetical protein